ncbi:MAG: DUF401 family protein [Nitrospiraceae bacterium]|nr:DUF401 family protein [Nitrospiraceae bacterium]
MGLPAEQRGFLNYWFRHPWEYVLPLYPGIVLAAAVTGVKLRELMFFNLPYALAVAATGYAFGLRGAFFEGGPVAPAAGRQSGGNAFMGFLSFLPIFSVLAMVIVFGIELHWAILSALAGLLVFYLYPPSGIWRVIKYSLAPDILLLIAGVMVFKQFLAGSGAVAGLGRFFTGEGISLTALLCAVPFTAGLLTGNTMAFVGATFPLVISLPGVGPHDVSFAFACGFLGVLMSPVHVCLILSRQYFKADLWGMYRKMLPAALAIFAVAAAEYLIFHV